MSSIVSAFGSVNITVPAGQSVAVYTQGGCAVYQYAGGVPQAPNYPAVPALIGRVANGQTIFGSYANGTVLQLQNTTGLPVYYEVGAAPVVKQGRLLAPVQVTPATLDATGTVTPALVLSGLVTSVTTLAVTGTLDTGANFEAADQWGDNDSVQWNIVNTGAANDFTLAAAANHTIVGAAVVAKSTSASFRTRRVSSGVFVTYRIA